MTDATDPSVGAPTAIVPRAEVPDGLTEPSGSLAGRGRLRGLRGQPGAVVALVWITILVGIGLFASTVARHDPSAQDLSHAYAGISGPHWLGTDDLGRDVFSRLVYGARISIRVSFEVVGLALLVALPLGLLAGYRGGRTDNVLMRIMDGGLSFPPLVLALAVVGVLGPGTNNEALAITLVFIPGFARLIRAQTLAVREEAFVEASHAIGTPPVGIVARRILPNVLSAVIVQVALALGGALVTEAGLAFLGLGAPAPAASWGSMLREAYDNALFTHPWALVAPGAAIALAVLAFNTAGDGLAATLGMVRPRASRRRRRTPRSRGLTAVTPRDGAYPIEHVSSDVLLSLQGLSIDIDTAGGPVRAVDHVSLEVRDGRVLGLVGESGSGKTLTALAIMRLLGSPPATITDGAIAFRDQDLLTLPFSEMRRIRGGEIGMVFQDPMTSLNPARTVGDQIIEAIRLHERTSRADARRRTVKLLAMVGIADPEQRARAYPHQLSGGMRQRVMIAMALSCRPRLLIADEPTTALDVTIQAEILDLLRHLQRTEGLGVLLVTHDLGVVADICDDVAVMYAGQIVESGPVTLVFGEPRHPYTEGLLGATLAVDGQDAELTSIRGQVPMLDEMPTGCRFNPRCPYANDQCRSEPPELQIADGRAHRCLRAAELTLRGAP